MEAEEALKLLEPLAEEEFLKFAFTDRVSKCCVLGHLKRLTSNDPSDYSHDNCDLDISLFKDRALYYLNTAMCEKLGFNMFAINNNYVSDYSDIKETKNRVIKALTDLKLKQHG